MAKPKKLKPTMIIVGCDEQHATVRITDQKTLRFIADVRREARAAKRKFGERS